MIHTILVVWGVWALVSLLFDNKSECHCDCDDD